MKMKLNPTLKGISFSYAKIFGLLLLCCQLPMAFAQGGIQGGGGDASEIRVHDIRNDILKWVKSSGPESLKLPQGLSVEDYRSLMIPILAPHTVVIGFVSSREGGLTSDPELKVSVDGKPKTCRGFEGRDGLPHILCNIERFASTSESSQYRLIHHEFAGLVGLEKNSGASSDYVISDQLTDYLIPETRLRLSIRRGGSPSSENSDNLNFVGRQIKFTMNEELIEGCASTLSSQPSRENGYFCSFFTTQSGQQLLKTDFFDRIVRPLYSRSFSLGLPFVHNCTVSGGVVSSTAGISALQIQFVVDSAVSHDIEAARDCVRQALHDNWVFNKDFHLFYIQR